ncbi:MAG: hypothetical protein KAS86_01600 [Candidatus Omnitrophica bacterium]|nr:hypothetical protein [Candidatus Omnitrophota bacterium]
MTLEGDEAWYYRPWVITAAILCFGPLGLVPLWFRPGTKAYIKTGVSIAVIALTVWMATGTLEVYKEVMETYEELSLVVGDNADKSY